MPGAYLNRCCPSTRCPWLVSRAKQQGSLGLGSTLNALCPSFSEIVGTILQLLANVVLGA